MSKNPVDENFYEQTLIELFQQMGYQYEYGPDVERSQRACHLVMCDDVC